MFLIEFSHINIFCFFRKILAVGNTKNLYRIGSNRVCKNEERMGERETSRKVQRRNGNCPSPPLPRWWASFQHSLGIAVWDTFTSESKATRLVLGLALVP